VVTFAAGLVWLLSADAVHVQDPPAPWPAALTEIKPTSRLISLPPEEEPPPTSPGELVKVRNPFDAAEVFEFPPGTSVTEARQAVADFLLQRARDRQSAPVEANRRPAQGPDRQAPTAADLVDNSPTRRP
jgi:hypothetical protein